MNNHTPHEQPFDTPVPSVKCHWCDEPATGWASAIGIPMGGAYACTFHGNTYGETFTHIPGTWATCARCGASIRWNENGGWMAPHAPDGAINRCANIGTLHFTTNDVAR